MNEDVITHRSDLFPLSAPLRRVLQPLLISAGYLLLYVALEKLTEPFAAVPGVKHFYLPAGLNFSLLLACGLYYAPVLALGSLVHVWLDPFPANPVNVAITALSVTATYSLGAAFARGMLLKDDVQLNDRRRFTQLLQVGVVLALAVAAVQSLNLWLAGAISAEQLLAGILNGTVGIALGILAVTPFFVLYAAPSIDVLSQKIANEKNLRAKIRRAFELSKQVMLEIALLLLGLALSQVAIFKLSIEDNFVIFALFSVPMFGIALKRGLGGVTGGMLALTLTVITLLWVFPAELVRVSELQAMVLASSFFFLITGSVATAKEQAVKGLHHREAVLESVAYAATQILNKSDWEKRVEEVLRHLGQATDVSRVYMVENRVLNGKLSLDHVIYEWSEEAVPPDSHHAKVLNLLRSHRMEESARLLADGHAYHYHTQDLAEKEQAIFTTLGIRSTLVVPIFVDRHWWGCLGLDRDLTQPDWSLAEITALRAAARILGTLLARATTEHQFRQLTGNIRAVFWISSPDGYRRIYASPAYEQIWGRSCASLHAEPSSWLGAIHASDSERVQAALVKQMWGEYDEEYRIILPDRSVRWIRDRGFPAKDEQGQVCHVVGLAEDITKQKQVEEQLKATTLLLSTLVDNLQSGILVEDENRRVIHVSQVFCEMFELPTPRESVLNVDSRLLFRRPKEFAGRIEQLIARSQRQMGEELVLEDGRILKRDYVPICTSADDRYHLWQYQDITDRKKAEQQIKSSLTEKEVLLKEIHHRVKNNLQIISSLLSLQGRQLDKGNSSQLFRDSQNRLKAMALIHERLYQSPDLAQIDFAGYVRGLSEYLLKTYQVNTNTVRLELNIERVPMTVDTAIPCSLVINELVSNSLKYAFPDDRGGTVRVTLASVDESALRLIVSDDGIGLPAGFDVRSTSSLGLKLVRSLTEQLGGSMLYEGNGPGTTMEIRFPRTK